MPRTPASVLIMTQLGEEHGVSLDRSLRGTGLSEAALSNPGTQVTARQELKVIDNLVSALGDVPALGLEAGVRYHLTTYGIWGFALLSSPTMRSAIETGMRYLDLTFALCRIRARERGGSVALVLDAPDVPVRLHRFVMERDSAAIQTLQRELFPGSFRLAQLSFTFEAGESAAAFHQTFGLMPTFGAEETMAAVSAELLDQPLPQADPLAAAMAQEQCRQLMAERQARGGVSGRVRDLLLADPSAPPSAEEVAGALHLSGRSLRHHLSAEGTSFRSLLEEVREQLADELLVTGGIPVAEVARRLGYTEVSSFSHAFRRWKGMGPRDYLSRHVRGSASRR